MNISIPIIVTVVVILLLCLIVFVYLQLYKKNINKALSEDNGKPKRMLEPYKLVFVLIVFFVSFSITVTSVSGLLYSKEYFRYEKTLGEDIESRTIFVDYNFKNNALRAVDHSDVKKIREFIDTEYVGRNIDVIPLYSTCTGIYLNGRHINLFAIDEENCTFLGLEEMQDGTAYFLKGQENKADLDICVIKSVDDGFVSDRLEQITLESKTGISEESLISLIKKKNMLPSMLEEPICFVNMDTFYEITSIMLDTKIIDASDLSRHSDLVRLEGIYVCVDSLTCLSSVSSALVEQNYKAYAPVDAFGDYEKTISKTFTIFILSSVGLVCLSAVNIYLILRTAHKLKNKDN